MLKAKWLRLEKNGKMFYLDGLCLGERLDLADYNIVDFRCTDVNELWIYATTKDKE